MPDEDDSWFIPKDLPKEPMPETPTPVAAPLPVYTAPKKHRFRKAAGITAAAAMVLSLGYGIISSVFHKNTDYTGILAAENLHRGRVTCLRDQIADSKKELRTVEAGLGQETLESEKAKVYVVQPGDTNLGIVKVFMEINSKAEPTPTNIWDKANECYLPDNKQDNLSAKYAAEVAKPISEWDTAKTNPNLIYPGEEKDISCLIPKILAQYEARIGELARERADIQKQISDLEGKLKSEKGIVSTIEQSKEYKNAANKLDSKSRAATAK